MLSAGKKSITKALAHQAMLVMQMMRLSQQSRVSAVVAERNRLARDIHDTLAQGFTGVIVQLEAAEDANSRGLRAESGAHVSRARELARDSLQEARRSVQALRPQALKRQDLPAAMSELIRRMTAGTTLGAHFEVAGEPPLLPTGHDENLLRICQEVLTNTLRHAAASHFTCALAFSSERIALTCHDNGRGFDPQAAHEGFGLLGMKERIEQMHGELQIESALEKETSVTVRLPRADATSR